LIDNKINHKRLSENIVEYIINCFINKTIKPGERVVESKIAKDLNTSQGSVREAIYRLNNMGFIISIPYKGSYIRNFTLDELKDYQKVRGEIELLAVRWAVKKYQWENFDLVLLEKLLKQMEDCLKDKDYLGRTNTTIEFHRILVKSSGSKCLLKTWESLNIQYWAHVWNYIDISILEGRSNLHSPIYLAIKNKDYKELKLLIRNHFYNLNTLI